MCIPKIKGTFFGVPIVRTVTFRWYILESLLREATICTLQINHIVYLMSIYINTYKRGTAPGPPPPQLWLGFKSFPLTAKVTTVGNRS